MEASDICKLARLARLAISDETLNETAKSITEVLNLVDQLQSAETNDVSPLAHPLDALQRLRADDVTETDQREGFQTLAPQVHESLYLVPEVIQND